MNKISFFSFKLVCALIGSALGLYEIEENNLWFQGKSWSEIEQSMTRGELNGYYSQREMSRLISGYLQSFPDVIQEVRDIGESYEKRKISAVKVGFPASKRKVSDTELGQTLIVAGHRGSDFVGMTMCMYLLKKFIFEYLNKNPFYIHILETRTIWIVPMLNVDTYNFIYTSFFQKYYLSSIEKSRRPAECDINNIGVNLGSNYDYDFYLSEGNREFTDACSKYYRGPFPFSESETSSIRSLISTYKFDVALNYIGYRNAIFLPVNSKGSSAGNYSSSYNSVQDYNFYETFKIPDFLPLHSYFGSRFAYQQEVMTGEPSDYMYRNHSIFSLTLELATDDPATQVIYPNRDQTMKTLRSNIYFTLMAIMKTGPFMRFYIEYQNWEDCKSTHSKLISCASGQFNYFLRVIAKNEGVRPSAADWKMTFAIEGNINIVSLYSADGIKSSNIFEETWSNITDKISYKNYETNLGLNMTKRYYDLQLPAIANQSSKVLLFAGYIPNIDVGDNLGSIFFIQDALKSTEAFQNFWLKSEKINVQRSSFIDQTISLRPLSVDDSNRNRLPSIILIIIYFGIVFLLILIGLTKSLLDKRSTKK